jgi:predicted transposase/invertase (TIGR01784 family)
MNLIPLTNDLAFKLVFTKEPKLLISLLNAVLFPRGGNQVKKIQILNPEIYPEVVRNKKSALDIRAEDSRKRKFHVEVQVGYQSLYIKRAIVYLASLIRDQIGEAEEYSLLKPVYQINILNFPLLPTDRYMSQFSLREELDSNITLTDDLQMVFLELPKFGKTVSEIRSKLDLWLYVFRNSAKLEEEEMAIIVDKEPDMANVFKILEYYSGDPEKRQLLEERMNADRDFAYEMVARFEAGMEKGMQKGKIEGKLEGKLETARLMLDYGDSIEKISKITGLTPSQLKENGII